MGIKPDDLPDVTAMLSIENLLNELYHSKTAGMIPALRERLRDLKSVVQTGNDIFRENVVSCLVELNLDLEASLTMTEADLLRSRQYLHDEMAQIIGAVERVSRYRAPSTTSLREESDQRIVKNRAAVAQLEQLIAAQQLRLAEIDESLKTLDHPTVQQALRNLIPSENEIDALLSVLKDRTVTPELVKAALVKLNKNLDLFEQGRRYVDVNAARGRLAERLDQQKLTLLELQRQLETALAKSGQFAGVDELLAQREPWLAQANKFVVHWQAVSAKTQAATEQRALQAALENARDYLVAVRRRFEAA